MEPGFQGPGSGRKKSRKTRDRKLPGLPGKGHVLGFNLHQAAGRAEHAGGMGLGPGQQPLVVELGGVELGLVEGFRLFTAIIQFELFIYSSETS